MRPLYFVLSQGAAGTTQIAPASPGNRHFVLGIVISLNNDGTWRLIDESGNLTGSIKQDGQLQPVVVGPNLIPFCQAAVNSALSIVTTQVAQGVVIFATEPQ